MATWKKVITAADDATYKNSNTTVADLGGGSGTEFLRKDGNWVTPTDDQLSTEQVQDIVGAMFSGNTETRISASYDDVGNHIDLSVTDMTANDQYTGTGVISVSGSNVISTTAQANVSGNAGNAAVYDNSGSPALKTGITALEMRTVIGAQAAGSYAALGGSSSQDFAVNNLSVTGTMDTVSVTNSSIVDQTITLSQGAANEAASSGAGIVIDTSSANEPALKWYDDTVNANVTGRIGVGWVMQSTTEGDTEATRYNIMGFRKGAGVPAVSLKSEGEGAFYWDTTNDEMYMCTNSYTNTGGG